MLTRVYHSLFFFVIFNLSSFVRKQAKQGKMMAKLLLANLPVSITLPDHLIVDHILPRLSVKTLIRFKSVSKFWFSVISTAEFAKSHLSFSSLFSCQFLLLSSSKKLLLLPYDECNSILKDPVKMGFTLDFCLFPQEIHFVGSCNGLVCLYISSFVRFRVHRRFMCRERGFFSICNPALHQYCEISNPDYGDFSPEDCHWFGYLPSIDDYKIVALFSSLNDDDDDQDEFAQFYMYSLRTGKWKIIHDLDRVDFDLECLSNKTTLVNNILYWSPKILDYELRLKGILGFDLVNEQLEEAPWMDWLGAYKDVVLIVINGCLASMCHSDDQISDVWVLKQHDNWNSWEKLYSIHVGVTTIFGITLNGKFLVHDCGLERGLHYFKIIDLMKDSQEQSQRDAYFDAIAKTAGAVGYVESLISPFGIGITKSAKEEDGEV